MADMYGFRDTGSREHTAHGWPDIGINDHEVGCLLEGTGLDRYKSETHLELDRMR